MTALPAQKPKRTPIRTFIRRLWHRSKIKAMSALTGRPTSEVALTPALIVAMQIDAKQETLLMNFRGQINGTSVLTRKSMEVAYQRAIQDVLTLLVPESKPGLVARARAALTGKAVA